ncbi:MAG: YicC/YloC family endoribonuclease [Candidatus Babeliales bacterium]
MLQSMTGFATTTISSTLPTGIQADISISLKSLNSRYFEAHCKLPAAFFPLETAFVNLIKSSVVRGKIYFTIYVSNPEAFEAAARPALNVVKGYIDAIEQIKQTHKIGGTVTIADIIHLPHVFDIPEMSIDEATQQEIFSAIKDLIDNLINERIREGKNLADDLNERITIMHKTISDIEKDAQVYCEKRKETLEQQLTQVNFSDEQLQEIKRSIVYAELDKIDINEEIVRFKSHIKKLQAIIESPKSEKGKQLDFTLQELFREINTIAAKCADAAINNKAIMIKVELEKSREMAQNIV